MDKCTRCSFRATEEAAMVVLPRKLLISKFTDSRQMDTEQWFVKKDLKKKRKRKRETKELKLIACA